MQPPRGGTLKLRSRRLRNAPDNDHDATLRTT
jgi:hypothetical protein